jgi:hypothetical protein
MQSLPSGGEDCPKHQNRLMEHLEHLEHFFPIALKAHRERSQRIPKKCSKCSKCSNGEIACTLPPHGKLVRLDIAERDAEIPLHAAFLGLEPTFAHGLTECGEGQHELVPLLGFLLVPGIEFAAFDPIVGALQRVLF